MNIKSRQNADSLLGEGHKGEVEFFARRHWASFLSQIALSFFMIVIPMVILIVFLILQPAFYNGIFANFIVITISVYYLITITFVFSAWITFYYDIYIVTKDTILDITQQGFFGRKTSQLSLLRIQDVSCRVSGIIPTMFGFGDVLVETAGEKVENFLLESVPDPQRFCAKVMELHDTLIAREGRDKQVMEGEGMFTAKDRIVKEPEITPAPEKEEQIDVVEPVDIELQPENSKIKEKEILNDLNLDPTVSDADEVEISKDDLNNGGEVKF